MNHDGNGWYYAFADGQLTDKWYSPLSLYNSSDTLAIGRVQGNWAYTGIADFFVHHGKCLHTSNFEPPRTRKSIYLEEDYWGNVEKNRNGANISANILVERTIGTRDIKVTLTNSGALDGYVYFQQRGKGVYFETEVGADTNPSAASHL